MIGSPRPPRISPFSSWIESAEPAAPSTRRRETVVPAQLGSLQRLHGVAERLRRLRELPSIATCASMLHAPSSARMNRAANGIVARPHRFTRTTALPESVPWPAGAGTGTD